MLPKCYVHLFLCIRQSFQMNVNADFRQRSRVTELSLWSLRKSDYQCILNFGKVFFTSTKSVNRTFSGPGFMQFWIKPLTSGTCAASNALYIEQSGWIATPPGMLSTIRAMC